MCFRNVERRASTAQGCALARSIPRNLLRRVCPDLGRQFNGSAGGTAGSSLSSVGTINGTGGSPEPNTSNALNQRTTGNNLGAPQTGAGSGPASHGNAVDTPAANSAAQNLGNTDTGILKK